MQWLCVNFFRGGGGGGIQICILESKNISLLKSRSLNLENPLKSIFGLSISFISLNHLFESKESDINHSFNLGLYHRHTHLVKGRLVYEPKTSVKKMKQAAIDFQELTTTNTGTCKMSWKFFSSVWTVLNTVKIKLTITSVNLQTRKIKKGLERKKLTKFVSICEQSKMKDSVIFFMWKKYRWIELKETIHSCIIYKPK